MRLNYKYTFGYSIITFFTLAIGFSIIYCVLKKSTSQTAIGKLRNLNTNVASLIASGKDITRLPITKSIKISLLVSQNTTSLEKVNTRRLWNHQLMDTITNISLTTPHLINKKHYSITSNVFIITPDSIYLNGILMAFAWTFVFLISAVVLSSMLISNYILSPFYSVLQAVKNFSIGQEEIIHFEKTTTYEFCELQKFIKQMTRNALKEYNALKEFSENASHELQTPIAVIKAKIELLMQTDLNEQQHIKLTSMYEELEKLSKINHALTLLTKLENFQSTTTQAINIAVILQDAVTSISDLANMKQITITANISSEVPAIINKELCQILFDNLLSNSLRHNVSYGTIIILLTDKKLSISNTGPKPTVDPEELFGRFKKNNQSLNSIGIGLAIVKKISKIFNFPISYKYIDKLHIIEIIFNKG